MTGTGDRAEARERRDRYAVAGNPVAHSQSPAIHGMFAAASGAALSYEAMEVPLDGFAAAVADFFVTGAGLNVTAPFKGEAFALATRTSRRAALAAAVNTLWLEDGILVGDNTDGIGLVRDITENHGVAIGGARVLLLGAGGAARGALAELLRCRPRSLTLANRTVAKAADLATAHGTVAAAAKAKLEALDYEGLTAGTYQVIINATSMGLQGKVPPIAPARLAAGCVCYDMMYDRRHTAFRDWAAANGAAVAVDGLGMLVEQAAESFFLWRGTRPATKPVIAALRRG